MPGLSRLVTPRRPEEAILGSPGRDAAVTAAVLALTAAAFAAVADHAILARIQRVDDAWLRLMVSGRPAPVTVIAKFVNLLGLVYVTLPVRIAIAGCLALHRRWWHMAAFVAAVALSAVVIYRLATYRLPALRLAGLAPAAASGLRVTASSARRMVPATG